MCDNKCVKILMQNTEIIVVRLSQGSGSIESRLHVMDPVDTEVLEISKSGWGLGIIV